MPQDRAKIIKTKQHMDIYFNMHGNIAMHFGVDKMNSPQSNRRNDKSKNSW